LIFGAVRINTTYIPVSVEDSGIAINKPDQEKILSDSTVLQVKMKKRIPALV
jgi:hypothetical protein